MAHKKSIQSLCDRELLEKILGLVESQKMSPAQNRATQTHRVYDNKTLMETLRIKDKYLKKLRDNGYLGYRARETSIGTHRRMWTDSFDVSTTRNLPLT